MNKKLDLNLHDENGDTLLAWAAALGSQTIVTTLIAKANPPKKWLTLRSAADALDIDSVNHDGKTALFLACENGHEEVVKVLLASGANPNKSTSIERSGRAGDTPVAIASRKRYSNIVEELKKQGAVTLGEKDGASLEMINKMRTMSAEQIKSLIDVKNLNQIGGTLLNYAAGTNRTDVMELLLKNGVDPAHVSPDGDSPLHYAALSGSIDAVNMLLDRKVDTNFQNADGCGPLYNAVIARNLAIVQLLINKQANPYLACNNHKTPFSVAKDAQLGEILKVLETSEFKVAEDSAAKGVFGLKNPFSPRAKGESDDDWTWDLAELGILPDDGQVMDSAAREILRQPN